MADKHEFYVDEVVTPQDLTEVEDFGEAADASRVLDLHGAGIAFGLALAQAGTPSLHLIAQAGVAYDSNGRRIEVAVDVNLNLGTDSGNQSTAVSAGNERYVAVYAHATRSNERPYSNGVASGFALHRETVELLIVAGGQAVTVGTPGATATVPTAPYPEAVLLGRVLRLPDTPSTQVLHTTDVRMDDVVFLRRAQDLYNDDVQRRLEVSPTDPPSLKVVVGAGEAQVDGDTVSWGGGASPAFTAPSTHGRIDLLYLTPSGTLAIRQGTEAASPVRPSTQGVLPLAFVGLEPAQATILDTDLADARPFLATQTLISRSYRLVAAGGETSIALPYSYVPGTGALTVSKNGTLLDSTQYTETDGSTVTLGAALTVGQVLVVRALTEAPVGLVTLAQVAEDLSGVMLGTVQMRTSTSTPTNIVIKGVSLVSDRGLLVVTDSLTLSGTSVEGGGGYVPSHWYYVYVWSDPVAGLQAELSSTAPDPTRTWKTGFLGKRRYLGAVRTSTASVPLPFHMNGGRYHYVASGVALSERTILLAGTATSYTAVSLATWLPPHARVAQVLATVTTNGSGLSIARLRRLGDTADFLPVTAPAASWVVEGHRELVTDSSQQIEYELSNSNGTLNLVPLGWEE